MLSGYSSSTVKVQLSIKSELSDTSLKNFKGKDLKLNEIGLVKSDLKMNIIDYLALNELLTGHI